MNFGDNDLSPVIRKVLMPALAAGAGTGALSAYLSRNSGGPHEDPRHRRRRIMRNALIGTALGGTAGAVLPTGLEMLSKPFAGGHMPFSERAADSAGGFALNHAAGLGTGVAGGLAVRHNVLGNRTAAQNEILQHLPGVKNLAQLRTIMNHPEGAKGILETITKGMSHGNDYPNAFWINERLQEAGLKGKNVAGMADIFKGPFLFPGEQLAASREKFLEHLGRQGPVSKLMAMIGGHSQIPGASKLNPTSDLLKPLANRIKGFDPLTLAENYSRWIRPSVSGRFAPVFQAAGVGAGALGADYLQQRLMGN